MNPKKPKHLVTIIAILVVLVGVGYVSAKTGAFSAILSSLTDPQPQEGEEKSEKPPTQVKNPAPTPGATAISVTATLQSADKLVNTAIVIEDIVSFDHLCTDVEGGNNDGCVTKVYLGSLQERNIEVKVSGQSISCPMIVYSCQGWKKNQRYRVLGVLRLRVGSENFIPTYFLEVTSNTEI